MTATQDESIASLRLLIAVAKADGVLHDKERVSLEEALADVALPDGLTLESLLAEQNDLVALVGHIRSDEMREEVYTSAYALAYADGNCSDEERELLERLRKAFSIADAQEARLARLFSGLAKGTVVAGKPSEGAPAFSGIEREAKVDAETRKTAIVCALLGAFPLPGVAIATDLMVAGMQVGLARDIGSFWGKEIDRETAKGILAWFGVGTGARIAVSNLLKVFPVWGAAFGAATAYASTYAVGKAMNSYFEGGAGMDAETLKKTFEAAKKEGKAVYERDKAEIEHKQSAHQAELIALGERLRKGEIDQAEFERQAAALGQA